MSVAVLMRQEFISVPSLASQLPPTGGSEAAVRLAALVMLQVVTCLKTLHGEASLSQLVTCREDKQATPRVCVLPEPADKVSRTFDSLLTRLFGPH